MVESMVRRSRFSQIFILLTGFLAAIAQAQSLKQTARYVPGEVIVKLKSAKALGANVSSKAVVNNLISKASNHRSHLAHKGQFAGLNIHQFKAQDLSVPMDEIISDLSAMDEVEYAEPNYVLEKMSADTVSESYSWTQIQSLAVGTFSMTSASIQAVQAQAQVTTPGAPVVVAIIDTGVDYTHSSFANAIWSNPGEIAGNGIDDDHNGYIDDIRGWNFAYGNNNPMDDDGHGTHVSGIVLGTAQDIFGTPPASPTLRLMPLKFLDASGSGSTSGAISAIYYAVNNGARVLNNSWGGGGYSQALEEAIAYAYNKDAVFVAAAGNNGANNDAIPMYPASYGVYNVMSVAATNDSDILASFSNYGGGSVHLSAPGVSILSTYPGNTFAYLSGTSMATPFVSGVAALMRHESPTMNSYQVRGLLLSSVDGVAGLIGKVSTQGRVNNYKSVTAAKSTAVSADKPSYSVTPNINNRSLAGAIMARGGAGCGAISLVGRLTGGRGSGGPYDGLKGLVISACLLLVPLFVIFVVRQRQGDPISRRRFDRFRVDSSVKFRVGGQEFVGAVKTISVGGSDLNTEQLLSEGSIITMTICSPDGFQQIQVQGHVVWSQAQKRYGIEFKNLADEVRAQIASWTRGLAKAA